MAIARFNRVFIWLVLLWRWSSLFFRTVQL